MKFKLEIDIGSERTYNRGHLANALRAAANQVLDFRTWLNAWGRQHPITNLHGIEIGYWKVEKDIDE